MKTQSIHPKLIIVRGIPGSGKSYFAEVLQQTIGKEKTIMLDPDATDYNSPEYIAHVKQQNIDGVDPKLHPYRFLRAKAYKAITDSKIILWNQPFTNLEILKKVTDRLQEYAAESGTTLPILVIEVSINPKIAKERVEKRRTEGGHGPSENTFDRFVNEYSTSSVNGYSVVEVNGEDDPSVGILKVTEVLNQLI